VLLPPIGPVGARTGRPSISTPRRTRIDRRGPLRDVGSRPSSDERTTPRRSAGRLRLTVGCRRFRRGRVWISRR
jgi:hypothetical protein